MKGNRKAAEEYIIKYIGKIAGKDNAKLHTDFFKGLTDKQFNEFMSKLESGEAHLSVVAPNYSKTSKLTVKNNLKVAKEMGHDFFQKLWIGPKKNEPKHLTPITHMVIDMPFRRVSQLLTKKISVADNNKSTSLLTGQYAGKSKSSKISYPEIQILAALDLDNTIVELIKYRGGDKRGGMALDILMEKYGSASQAVLERYSSGVESTRTLKTFLTAMHLKNSL